MKIQQCICEQNPTILIKTSKVLLVHGLRFSQSILKTHVTKQQVMTWQRRLLIGDKSKYFDIPKCTNGNVSAMTLVSCTQQIQIYQHTAS